MSGVIRWESPRPTGHTGRPRLRDARFQAAADELRALPGKWGVIVECPKGENTTLATHIRTGALAPFAPSGDFDACSRIVDGHLVVYARYLGDGDGS
jgi:hypothetical protein